MEIPPEAGEDLMRNSEIGNGDNNPGQTRRRPGAGVPGLRVRYCRGDVTTNLDAYGLPDWDNEKFT